MPWLRHRRNFPVPGGVQQVEVCADTGTLPSAACPEKANRWFATDRPPLPPEADLWQMVKIDKATGQRAGEFTPPKKIMRRKFSETHPSTGNGPKTTASPSRPQRENTLFNFAPEVAIAQPSEGQGVQGVVSVVGVANVPAFASYGLQFGVGHNPGAFSTAIWGPVNQPSTGGFWASGIRKA